MENQVKKVLLEGFPGMQVDLEHCPGQKITGSVVWDGFTGLDHMARQKALHQVLQVALGSQVHQIGVLLTYTPAELDCMLG